MVRSKQQRSNWAMVVDLTRRFTPEEFSFDQKFRDEAILATNEYLTKCENLLREIANTLQVTDEYGNRRELRSWELDDWVNNITALLGDA